MATFTLGPRLNCHKKTAIQEAIRAYVMIGVDRVGLSSARGIIDLECATWFSFHGII